MENLLPLPGKEGVEKWPLDELVIFEHLGLPILCNPNFEFK